MITKCNAIASASAGFFLLLKGAACDLANGEGTPSESSPVSNEQGCEFLRAPRWVLRDKDGGRVRALVEPRCGRAANAEAGARCVQLDFGTADSYPCVRIIDSDGAYINLQYELKSGQLGPCQGGDYTDANSTWKETSLPIYTSGDCQGQPYISKSPYGYSEFTESGTLYFAEGDAWYVSEDRKSVV